MGSRIRWAIVDQEAFATNSNFEQLSILAWGGVRIFTGYRDLADILKLKACFLSVSKALAQH